MKQLLKKKTKVPEQPVISGHVAHYIDYKSKRYHQITMVSTLMVFAIAGSLMIFGTSAATRKYVAVDAETATKSGNVSSATDTTASSGAALRFDAPPVTTTPTPPPTPAPDPTILPTWGAPIYREEFSGSSVDTTRWGVYHNNYGSGNNELECNTPNNVAVSSGLLTITGKKQTYACPGAGTYHYTSAFLGSRNASTPRYYPLYGRFEMRARVPHGQGLWPAFWLRHKAGSSAAEVDIVELFHNQLPGKVTSTLHFPNSISSNVAKKSTAFETAVQGTGGWHTFAVEITNAGTNAVKFVFYVDGAQTLTYTNTNASSWTKGYENGAWDIALNMAIGGNWVGNPDSQLGYLPYTGKCSLNNTAPSGGNPANCPTTGIWLANMAQRDAVYQIDYVRVWQHP